MTLCRAWVSLLVVFAAMLCHAQLNTVRMMEIGRNALYFEDYVLSIQYFNQVIDAKPFLHEPYFFRGLAKFYLDDYTGAEQDLDVAIEKNPYVARSYQLRGLCRAKMDSLATAENDFRMAIKYDPQNANVWQNLAMVAMQSEDWEKASRVIDSLLLFSPRNSDAYLLRMQVSMNLKDTAHAMKMVGMAVDYDRYSPEVYDARAIMYYQTGDYEAAVRDLDKAIDLMPARSGSYINRALVRYHMNDLRGAMEDYDMAVYVEPTSFLAHYNRGLLRMNVGDDNRAIEDFDKVLEIDPDNTLARFNRALLRENIGEYKGAIDDYSRVIEDYPNFEQAYRGRASARRKYGDKKGAEADERWLLKRQIDIYNKGVDAFREEYSADNDKTRKRSDENIRNYNKMVVADDSYSNKYTTEYRGKIQHRNVFVELEPMFVLTYYQDEQELEGLANYYKPLEELNRMLGDAQDLLLTNNERALSEMEVKYRFDNINVLSEFVSKDSLGTRNLMLRALDCYLVQDLEASMADLDHAIAVDSVSWNLYFVRSFVRARQLESEGIDTVDDVGSVTNGQVVGPFGLDYRLVKEDLDRVIALVPDFAYAYFNRGNVSVKLSDYKSAIVDYTRAIELNDRFAEAYFNRGLARMYTGNVNEGAADLSKAGELGLFQAYNVMKRFKYSGRR